MPAIDVLYAIPGALVAGAAALVLCAVVEYFRPPED